MQKYTKTILAILFFSVVCAFAACNSEEKHPWNEIPEYELGGFAKGADVSWLTEMEKTGVKFYSQQGQSMECMQLLRTLGANSIRLRVWVDPQNGWNNEDDVLIKAWRAQKLGMRIMIDFHYSDTWADPGQQAKPLAWQNLSFSELKTAIHEHTVSVLTRLKENKISPEWVQVGNETGNGMLWDDGKASENMKNYAELNNAGYEAVKSVFPDSKVIIHLQEGDKNSLYRWLFDGLKDNNGKWDVIGMSLYPSADNWEDMTVKCVENMNDMISRYNTEVMVCEVGMPWDQAEACKDFLTRLITNAKAIPGDKCLGVFYWEPQAYNGWNGYTLGAFDNSGRPTVALEGFR